MATRHSEQPGDGTTTMTFQETERWPGLSSTAISGAMGFGAIGAAVAGPIGVGVGIVAGVITGQLVHRYAAIWGWRVTTHAA